MEAKQTQEAKRQMMVLMQEGIFWQEAARRAGVQTSRSTAYRWFAVYRTQGEAAFHDGRHGHPAKLREPVRKWLETTCRETPEMPSRVVQAALQERFGILVSIGHLNRMRAALGGGSQTVRREKNCRYPVPQATPTGKKEQEDSSW